jgi:hypothetical protein
MSYPQTGAGQGDIIYFYDTSTGQVVSRSWDFPGGTPTGATSTSPLVVYNIPNTNGWDVKLLITDASGITGVSEGKNIIVVFPENFTLSFTPTPSSSLIDQNVTYQSTGTAASGLTGSGFNWIIPGLGATSGISLSSVSYSIPEWFDLTGTYIGSPNQSYLATATLSAVSNLGNNFSVSKNVTFSKLGPEESVNYADSVTYAISGPYYTPSVFGYTTSSLNLGGNNIVLEIDQNYPSQAWDNDYFHSTDEAVYFYSNSTDYSDLYSALKFKFIWNGNNLSLGGISVPGDPRFNVGNYIITGDVSANFSDKFWITDYTTSGAQLTQYAAVTGSTTRKWSNSYIQNFLANTYHLSNSSKYIENAGFNNSNLQPLANLASVNGYLLPTEEGYSWNGGYTGVNQHGVCVPTSSLINDLYGYSGAVVDLNIVLYSTTGLALSTTNVVLSPSGTSGNTPDGYLIKAQSDGYGLGLADLINLFLSSNSMNNHIQAEAQSYYAPYEGGNAYGAISNYYNSTTFNGLRISVLQPTYAGNPIGSIQVTWGPAYQSHVALIPGLPGSSVLNSPFAGTNSSTSSFVSWSGLNQRLYVNPNTNPYFRGWKLGGSL